MAKATARSRKSSTTLRKPSGTNSPARIRGGSRSYRSTKSWVSETGRRLSSLISAGVRSGSAGWRSRILQGQRLPMALLSLPLILGVAAVAAASEAIPPPEPTRTPFPSRTPVPAPSVTPTFLPPRPPPPTATPTPTASPTRQVAYTDWAREKFGPPWQVDCEDDKPENGYRLPAWARGFCVPGLITYEAWWYDSPNDFYGLMSSHAPGHMGGA